MRKLNRRKLLKAAGVATTGALASGVASAADERQSASELSFTRRYQPGQRPIEPDEIEARKEELLETSPTIDGLIGRRSPIELSEDEIIVAYNFDVFDGVPTEYVGTHERSEEKVTPMQKRSGEGTTLSEQVREQHAKADALLSSRKRQYASSGTPRTSNVQSVGTTSNDDQFADWTKLVRSRHHKTDDEGNEMGWTCEWRRNPSQPSAQALKTQIRMYPKSDDLYGDYEADTAESAMRFNKDLVTVRDHKPGNTIEQSSSSYSLAWVDGNLQVGFGGSTTSSNLHIDDKSNVDSEMKVIHKYNVSGGLRDNSLFLNAASTVDANETSGETFVNIDLHSTFQIYKVYWSTWTPSPLENHYRYYWS